MHYRITLRMDRAGVNPPPIRCMQAERLKILWVSCVGEKGGAEVYLLNLLRHLDRDRFEPEAALLRPGPLENDLRALEVPVHVFPAHRMRQLGRVWHTARALGDLARQRGVHLIHSNGFRAHLHGALAAHRAGCPEYWTVHTVEKPGLITSALLTLPTRLVIANCPRTADYFIGKNLPVSLIWPGVDIDRLENHPGRKELAKRLGLPLERRWLIQAGRLQRYKGQEHLIQALARLVPRHPDLQAVVVGGALFGMEQDYLDALRTLARDLGVADRVTFTGFVSDEDLAGLMAASTALIHPALEEDFGLVVAEAQALGIPVVAFDAVGPAAILEHRGTGLLVPVGDAAALVTAMDELLSRPDRARAWGERGRQRTRERFEAREGAHQLERLYLQARPVTAA